MAGWVITFGIVVVIAFVCAIIGSALAGERGRSTEGFWLGLFFGPIGIVMSLLLSPKTSFKGDAAARQDFRALVKSRGRIGAMLDESDGRTIVSVKDGGAASQAGMRVGDRLVAIDGELVDGDYKANILRATGEVGTTVKLTIRRGEEIHHLSVKRV